MVSINEAAKAVQAAARQSKNLVIVGEALTEIKNLEAYKAEAERAHLQAKGRLEDLNQQVGASEQALADAAESERQGKERADEAHRLATTTLTNANAKATRIVNEAQAEFDRQVKLNEQRLAEHAGATDDAIAQLDLKKDFLAGQVEQAQQDLEKIEEQRAELRAKLS